MFDIENITLSPATLDLLIKELTLLIKHPNSEDEQVHVELVNLLEILKVIEDVQRTL